VTVGAGGLLIPWQREPKGRTRWLTQDEVGHLAQACLPRKHGVSVAALVRFLAETGLRVGEALALRWDDLELEGPRAHALVRTSKNGDARWVPLTEEAAQAAHSMRTQQRGPWVGLSQSVVNHVFRAAREAVLSTAGDREVVVHTLRHTAASRLVRAGVSLPVVSAWLGHRDFRSTLRYTHIDQDGLTAAARMLQEKK
jgi:integrase